MPQGPRTKAEQSSSTQPFDCVCRGRYLQDNAVLNILPLEYIFLSGGNCMVRFRKNDRDFLDATTTCWHLEGLKTFAPSDKFYSLSFFVGDRQSDQR